MARGATIFKVDLDVADMDRDYYAAHSLTIACHPSETEERMMVRLLAFVLFAGPDLAFGTGIATQGEPALWKKDLTGAVQLWIEIGHPDAKDLRRACGKSRRVVVICYGGRASNWWWTENQAELKRLANLTILRLAPESTQALGSMAERTMRLQCNVQDGVVSIIQGDQVQNIEPETLLGSRA